MPYIMKRLVAEDGALIERRSHFDVRFLAGQPFGSGVVPPVLFELDTDVEGRRMPTLFMVPAFVARRELFDTLLAAGVDNVEAVPAVITDPETGAAHHDYLVLNVVGRLAAADLDASEAADLGDGMHVVDRLVLDPARTPGALIFRLDEDPVLVVVADDVRDRLLAAGFTDIHFEPVTVGA